MTIGFRAKTLAILPLLAAAASVANAAVCPIIGASSGCSVVITSDATGHYSLASTGVGPYDPPGFDDTLIGVVNNGPKTLVSLRLTGSDIFGFDSDGIDTYPGGGSYGPTGYEGPKTSFVVANPNHGTVLFTDGLASGATAYFALEGDLSGKVGTAPPLTIGGVPEPAAWALMLAGFGAVGAAVRRRGAKVVAA